MTYSPAMVKKIKAAAAKPGWPYDPCRVCRMAGSACEMTWVSIIWSFVKSLFGGSNDATALAVKEAHDAGISEQKAIDAATAKEAAAAQAQAFADAPHGDADFAARMQQLAGKAEPRRPDRSQILP